MSSAPGGPAAAVAVRVYCTVDDTRGDLSLIEAVTTALDGAGALAVVVLRASRGFGRARRIRDVDAVDSGMNHPAVIEWVDTVTGFDRIWPVIRPLVDAELVTVEAVTLTPTAARRTRPGAVTGGAAPP